MEIIVQATPADAVHLIGLYAKALKSTGFGKLTSLKNREELTNWLKSRCSIDEIWFSSDDGGPIVLGHFEPVKNEVVTIVTRDDMEGRGQATAMLKKIADLHPSVAVRPVTRGGKLVARKCDFAPCATDSSRWIRS